MNDTAVSSTDSARGIVILGISMGSVIFVRTSPRRVISRCPAIRLAVSRTHSVMGRISLLINSIITINMVRMGGVPCGSRCAIMWLVFFSHPKVVIINQEEMDSGSVTVKCEVKENTCGYKARKFVIKISTNVDRITISTLFSGFIRLNLISFFMFARMWFIIFVWGGFIVQCFVVSMSVVRMNITQDIDKMEVLGSNTEKRLVIMMFVYFFCLWSFFQFCLSIKVCVSLILVNGRGEAKLVKGFMEGVSFVG